MNSVAPATRFGIVFVMDASQRPRKVARKTWEVIREERAEVLPPGLLTMEELMDWPLAVVKSICCSGLPQDEENALRLHTNLMQGITLYTDYSGMDCPREALELGIAACEKVMGWSFPRPPLRVGRTCDKGAVQDCRTFGGVDV